LSGYAQSGKDTAAAELVRRAGFERRAFADALKAVAYDSDPDIWAGYEEMSSLSVMVDVLGWDEVKQYPDVRLYLQLLGVAARKHLGEDVWVKAVERTMSLYGRYVITDVRFPNEYAWIRSKGGVIIRITRPGVGPVNEHVSEQLADADAYVTNDGTPGELGDEVLAVYERLSVPAELPPYFAEYRAMTERESK